ncbi:sigma-70 family RNA polymerase sigma factor [Streptomyces sp. SID4928]|uniref:sigma-70 family RNA polymerase sigma factor n=1 Tax=Streptomyces TaxID=1883 RepID=UPI0001C192A8|nr:sigma-70 family RNA polymerase sigma factor [Streptomyces sp. ACT-1]EGE39644.1 RNA polymerase sigma factor, sigma-70 family [Streptomyces sp. ACT-1]MYR47731.1 sigma-70 family RNA polymerase sigma factor [Streptomyces sp. SID4928]
MTTPFEPQASALGPAPRQPARPGRKLGPIAPAVSSSHRAWLEPVRDTYRNSGFTLGNLSDRVHLAKSKLSELLRGVGLYPRWEVIHRLGAELDLPSWPLHRLWRQAALDAGKAPEWIERSSHKTTHATARPRPPLEHAALRQLVEPDYHFYAQAFLSDQDRDTAVKDTFATLWLRWDTALRSPDTQAFAWSILRTTVMARATHRDGRPELEAAVFDTIALQTTHSSPAAAAARMPRIVELFKGISKLPAPQLDAMVLLHLCGFTAEKASSLLGVPLATVRADERRATRYLETIFPPHPTEGPTS